MNRRELIKNLMIAPVAALPIVGATAENDPSQRYEWVRNDDVVIRDCRISRERFKTIFKDCRTQRIVIIGCFIE